MARHDAPLAQLAEQQTLNPLVPGPIPCWLTCADLGFRHPRSFFMRPVCPHVRSMFAREFGPSPGGLVKSAPSRAGCGGMRPGAAPLVRAGVSPSLLDQWSRPSRQAPGACPESRCRCHYAAWNLLVVGTFWLCTPDAVGGARQPSPLEAASPLGTLTCGQRPECGWARRPPVPAEVQLAAAKGPLRTGRHCLVETAKGLRRVSAALGKLGRGRPQPGRAPRSAGLPGACRERAHTGCVRPRRATAEEPLDDAGP
jgi:hypothetical protein